MSVNNKIQPLVFPPMPYLENLSLEKYLGHKDATKNETTVKIENTRSITNCLNHTPW